MQRPEERRPAVRVGVDLKATYGVLGTVARYPARVTEISASGLRLRTTERLRLGSSLKLAFDVDGPNHHVRLDIQVTASIVRILRDEPPLCEYALRLSADKHPRDMLRQAVLMVTLASHVK